MTDNEKLARWQGNPNFSQITLILQTDTGYWPDYPNDEAAAMSLLDTLAKKDYEPELYYNSGLAHWKLNIDGEPNLIGCWQPTRREAVVAAVLELIGKEGV